MASRFLPHCSSEELLRLRKNHFSLQESGIRLKFSARLLDLLYALENCSCARTCFFTKEFLGLSSYVIFLCLVTIATPVDPLEPYGRFARNRRPNRPAVLRDGTRTTEPGMRCLDRGAASGLLAGDRDSLPGCGLGKKPGDSSPNGRVSGPGQMALVQYAGRVGDAEAEETARCLGTGIGRGVVNSQIIIDWCHASARRGHDCLTS
jgi:hypothetical protein